MPIDPTESAPEQEQELSPLRGAEQFVADARTEKTLIGHNFEFEFTVVNLTDVDLSVLDHGHPHRQMRDEVIHADVAQRYADDLKWGAQFPAGVLSRHGSTYRVVDFHHRLWAARSAGLTQISAYVVGEMEDFDQIELGNLLNRNHGVPLSEAERIRQALWGLDLGRFANVKQAARTLGIDERKVSKEKRIREARARAEQAGVSLIAFDRLPRATQERLSSLDSPQVFKSAADTVINKALGTTEAGKLVAQVNSVGGDAAKLDVLKTFAAVSEPRKAVPAANNLADPWFRIHTACRAILAVDLGAEFDMSLGRRSTHDLEMLEGEMKAVTEKLAAIAAKVETAAAAAEPVQADAG